MGIVSNHGSSNLWNTLEHKCCHFQSQGNNNWQETHPINSIYSRLYQSCTKSFLAAWLLWNGDGTRHDFNIFCSIISCNMRNFVILLHNYSKSGFHVMLGVDILKIVSHCNLSIFYGFWTMGMTTRASKLWFEAWIY